MLTCVESIYAQSDTALGGYTAMEIEAGRMKGNFATGAIEEMTGGVRIRLLSDNPSQPPLPIEAETMKFGWVEGKTTPSRIVMENNVKVKHPDAEVKAGRAEWDFDSGELVFSKDPIVSSDRLKGLRGERMVLNLKTNTFEVTRVRAEQVPLRGIEAESTTPPNPYEFKKNDIKDWPYLIETIKKEAQTQAPSPGHRILAQMTPQNQQLLLQLDTDLLLERKEDMLRLLNNILTKSDFYSPEAWEGRSLPDEARQLAGTKTLNPENQARFNRLLIEAAYPSAFLSPGKN